MHDAESSLDYQGTYTGGFPGGGLPGIDTRLTLKKDGTFQPAHEIPRPRLGIRTKGAYKVKGNLLTLTPWTGRREYYKVEENHVRKLDADKQPVTGPLAENYVLKKTE